MAVCGDSMRRMQFTLMEKELLEKEIWFWIMKVIFHISRNNSLSESKLTLIYQERELTTESV